MTDPATPKFCDIEVDPETDAMVEEEVKKFLKNGGFAKGGFASTVRDMGVPGSLDLNVSLPTFADIGKLNLHTSYVINGLIPKESLTMIHARGGLGKTWLALQLGSCVAEGRPFVGLPTEKMLAYYIDYENSLSLLCDRAKVVGPSSMRLWHISNSISPPHLDSSEWILFKSLFPGLLIFDTLRSAQLLDENSSKDMALIMGRLKELRGLGFTIILLHHTQKADARTYKGSSAILDLCDHVLGLEKVKEVGSDTIVDDDETDLPFRLGTREKTRYEPFSMYLKFDPAHGFYLAGDPDDVTLMDLQQLLKEYQEIRNGQPNQTEFFKLAKDELELNRKKFLRLLRKGEGRFWVKSKLQKHSATVYCPLVPHRSDLSRSQPSKNIDLSPCSDTKNSTGTSPTCPTCPPCSPPLGGTGEQGTSDRGSEFEVREDGELTY